MFIILAYDIPDNRRRTRLFKSLKRFGSPVQESVFEFHLDAGELLRLKRAVNLIIDPHQDGLAPDIHPLEVVSPIFGCHNAIPCKNDFRPIEGDAGFHLAAKRDVIGLFGQ